MKTYAPKGLKGSDLRGLLSELFCTPLEASKYLKVTERSVWRWLSDGNAPHAVLSALWHETPRGREASTLDVGNALNIERELARAYKAESERHQATIARLMAITDTGAANDPLEITRLAQAGPAPARPALALPERKKAAREPPLVYQEQA